MSEKNLEATITPQFFERQRSVRLLERRSWLSEAGLLLISRDFMEADHYATLGLESDCTDDQIRAAYRILAKQHHPDRNPNSAEAKALTQTLNAAYRVLGNPDQRKRYDRQLKEERTARRRRFGRSVPPIQQDVHVRIDDLFRGTELEVEVNDPGNSAGRESYLLKIPPGTAPNARFRIERDQNDAGGILQARIKLFPDHLFKVRGSDLRCDLKIPRRIAVSGGLQSIRGPQGQMLKIEVPPGVARGEIIRVDGEGLPNPRGGRGDLLVRVIFQPEVRIKRRA